MSAELNEDTYTQKFRVESVEKTDAPEGLPGSDWHRYIIGQGRSKIEGLKTGTLAAVTRHAEAVADDLNLRATKGNSTYVSRGRRK